MQCPNCQQSDKVTIGNKDYCTNCGTAVDKGAAEVAAPAPVLSEVKALTPDPVAIPAPPAITATPEPEPVIATPTATPPPVQPEPPTPPPVAPMPVVAPTAPAPSAPVVPPAAPAIPTPPAAPTVKPAEQFHAKPRPVPAGSVLDLRQLNQGKATITPDRKQVRAVNAAQTTKSSFIQKFSGRSPQPAPAATPVAPKIPQPDLAAIAPKFNQPSPPKAPPAPGRTMPNAVATQIQAMNKPVTPTAHRLPISKKPASILAAAVAFALMGGYIWMQNYPKMALHIASGKAGFQASMPNYVPSSYSIDGPIAYAPGQIVINFRSAGDNSRLVLSERKTDWDSSSLLENYVSRQTKDYLAVENQGLTVFVYNGNQASWVNRGVWYTIEGENRLDRDQVLRIASSL